MTQRPWYERDHDRLEAMVTEALEAFPTLALDGDHGLPILRGEFPIIFEGKEVERFEIEVRLPERDPDDLPILREVDGRIPRTPNFHVNNPDGDTCLFVPDERWRFFPRGTSLAEFLRGPVRTHLIGAALNLRGDPWPAGERSHGPDGVFEYYAEMVGSHDRSVILSFIRSLADPKVKRHWPCPCGLGRSIRECHNDLITDLRNKIASGDAFRTLQYLAPSLIGI